jgi:ankyrin repeat protein
MLHRALVAASGLPVVEDVAALLAAGANPAFSDPKHLGWTALCRAAWAGAGPNVSALLADPRTDVNVVDTLDRTPLYLAALGGHAAVVEALLAKGADVRVGVNPLFAAAGAGAPLVAQRLLGAGARHRDRNSAGDSPLHVAAREGHADVVGVLLGAGAGVGEVNKAGETALQLATMFEHEEAAALLQAAQLTAAAATA